MAVPGLSRRWRCAAGIGGHGGPIPAQRWYHPCPAPAPSLPSAVSAGRAAAPLHQKGEFVVLFSSLAPFIIFSAFVCPTSRIVGIRGRL